MDGTRSRFQGFFDESFNEEFYVLAGYGATEDAWAAFRLDWAALMQEHGMTKPFKAKGRITGKVLEKGDKLIDGIFELTQKHGFTAYGVAHDCRAFAKVMRIADDRRFRNRYYSIFARLLPTMMRNATHLWRGREVTLTFDERGEASLIGETWHEALAFAPPDARSALTTPPQFMKDEDEIGLQLADLAAWVLRHQAIASAKKKSRSKLFKKMMVVPIYWEVWNEVMMRDFVVYSDQLNRLLYAARDSVRVGRV